ncbi:hypothetical protein [Nakamurella lactea]|uniref:hypothetical protein n=1 Tax=Nakamurella lactea TaxID=459515 RepID=UPI0012B56E20|nr:hypothetical protein [Nakamurella lactea]
MAPPRPRLAVAPDYFAGFMLILGGLAGVLELLLPWSPAVEKLPKYGSLTGWDKLVIGSSQQLSVADSIALYSVLAVAIAGGACILLGLAMFTPIDHQPFGAVALLVSVVSIGGAVWWVLRSRQAAGGLGPMLSNAQIGWYLFAVSGIVCLIGAIKALATP